MKRTFNFENIFRRKLSLKNAIMLNSGSSANLLAFSALTSETLGEKKIKPNDEIITLAAGFPTTVAPIIHNGCVPVYLDVELDTANIDTKNLKNQVLCI